MQHPSIQRFESCGVTLLGDISRPGGVTFGFTERTGGVSKGVYSSLNLGSRCGDSAQAVAANRALALRALGLDHLEQSLIEPKQVHGDHIVCVRSHDVAALDQARAEAQAGVDAIVCTATDVPVLLCFADCVPVILVDAHSGAFAVVHSGWRGTLARIAAKAARALMRESGADSHSILAYIGPHICGADYEVSEELLASFEAEFGTIVNAGGSTAHLDLSRAIVSALTSVGIEAEHISDCCPSTATNLDRFYSYRAEHGQCGRHAAIACLLKDETPSLSGR